MSSRLYLTHRRLVGIAASLTPRDRAVLDHLLTLRLASGIQLRRLAMADLKPRQQRAVLASLVTRNLTRRLPRSVGGVAAGSRTSVYGLGPAGWRLLVGSMSRRHAVPQIGAPFVAHTVAVSELYVQLHEADRAGRLTLASWTGEPATWRGFIASGGGRTLLKPDAAVRVRLGDYEDSWFVEVDRATESTTAIARACDRYRSYWQTGREQAQTGVFPKVLWLVPDAHRYNQLVAVLAKQPASAWHLFMVALQADGVDRIAQGATS